MNNYYSINTLGLLIGLKIDSLIFIVISVKTKKRLRQLLLNLCIIHKYTCHLKMVKEHVYTIIVSNTCRLLTRER